MNWGAIIGYYRCYQLLELVLVNIPLAKTTDIRELHITHIRILEVTLFATLITERTIGEAHYLTRDVQGQLLNLTYNQYSLFTL